MVVLAHFLRLLQTLQLLFGRVNLYQKFEVCFPNFKKYKMPSYFLRCLRPCKLLLGITVELIHAVNTHASFEDVEFNNSERKPFSHPKFRLKVR
jgi:hypothetical protein